MRMEMGVEKVDTALLVEAEVHEKLWGGIHRELQKTHCCGVSLDNKEQREGK